MRSPLYLRRLVVVVVAAVVPTVLAGCSADSSDTQRLMDGRLAWSEAALPLTGAEGFEGAASGTLDASAEYIGGAVGLGSVSPGDHVVHLACRGEDPVEFRVTSTGNSELAATTLDCGGSTVVEVTTTTEGLVVTAEGEGPADWAVAVVRSGDATGEESSNTE